MDDAIPMLELKPTQYIGLIAETSKQKKEEKKKEKEEKELGNELLRSSSECVSSVMRPTIRK